MRRSDGQEGAGVWRRVEELVTRPPVVVVDSASLTELSRTLWAEEVGTALVVTAEGKVVGLVSERDVVAALATGLSPAETTVTELMNAPIVAVGGRDRLYDAAVEMLDLGIRHVPVADESGTYTGVLSIRDILRPLLVDALGG